MSYDLEFSPEFFFAEGEPYDCLELAPGRPVSVWQAIEDMRLHDIDERWAHLAIEHFKVAPEHLTPETVLEAIRKTNTCSNLSSPVQVWIDPAGWYTVQVWNKENIG